MPSDEDYLEALREFAADLGHTPTRTEMNDSGPYSSTPYYNRWGSWNDALKAAGLDTNHEYVTEEQLLEELRRVQEISGEPVLVEDVDEHGDYDPSTYFRRFNSWFDAREAAGLNSEDVRPGRRADPNKLVDELQELALELGRPPSQNELNERGEYSLSPYLTQWGSFERALQAAGLREDES